MKKTNGENPAQRPPGRRTATSRIDQDSDCLTATDYIEALADNDGGKPGSISLQVHIPFCPVRCLNCECNVTVTHDSAAIDRYLDALQTEVSLVVERIGSNRQVNRLHIGGGSPNYLSDSQLVRLVSILEQSFGLDASTTLSLVANARHTSSSQLSLLRGLGFTRINFPTRDVDPEVQLAIGRVQSFDMLREVFDSARHAGFESVGTDISYGLPKQSTQTMRRSVKLLKLLAPDQISCKPFTRMIDAFPHQLAIADSQAPSLADKLALLNVVVEELTSDEYAWIGLDFFTRREDPLHQAQLEQKLRRNWLGYTLDETNNVLGFGTHSVSEVGSVCVQNHFGVRSWHESLAANRLPIRSGIRMTSTDKRYRHALTNLMCNLESADCEALLELEDDSGRIDHYHDRGLVEIEGDRIAITPQGRMLLPQLWGETVPGQYRWQYPA